MKSSNGSVKGKKGSDSNVFEQDGTVIRFGGFGRDYFDVLAEIGTECDEAAGRLCKALPRRVEVIDWKRGAYSGAIAIDFPMGGFQGTSHYGDLRYDGTLITSNIDLGCEFTIEPNLIEIIDDLVNWGSMEGESEAMNMIVELHMLKRMDQARHLKALWNWYVARGKSSEELYGAWLRSMLR